MSRSLLACALSLLPSALLADDIAPEPTAPAPVDPAVVGAEEDARRSAAVTLNYCRASLYRIRCAPTDRVLAEERANILSNLNLAAIEDEEVLRLYTAVLDEIAAVRIAERDRNRVAILTCPRRLAARDGHGVQPAGSRGDRGRGRRGPHRRRQLVGRAGGCRRTAIPACGRSTAIA